MTEARDYVQWHEAYDDADSGLSWRLGVVQQLIEQALDRYAGPVRVLSSCAGDGRDILGVLAGRDDAHRVDVTLLELDPTLAARAREQAASSVPSAHVTVRTIDAGSTTAYAGAVPADLVLLVGIFGNISDDDVKRTIDAAPQLCRPGATLLWSRGRKDGDLNPQVRRWFADAGFAELDYLTLDRGNHPAVGAMRYDGPPRPLVREARLFTFVR